MGEKRIELLQCEEPISPDQMLDMQDNANQHVNNLVEDVLGGGVVSATLAPTGTGVGVSISAFECWSSAGHGKQTAAVEVSLAGYIPTSGYKWISIFATPGFESGDFRANAYGANEYHKRTETVVFSVREGTASILPINPGGGAVRVCSVRLSAGMSALLSGQIQTTSGKSDRIIALSAKVSKAGDTLTGTLAYNGRPLSQMNSGAFTFSGYILWEGSGNPDYDGHYYAYTNYIDTKIVSNHLAIQLSLWMRLNFFGTEVDMWVQPISMRMNSDFLDGAVSGKASEGIYVIYEKDANANKTGKFLVVCIGTQRFVQRFATRKVQWTAIAPQPVLTLEG